MAKVFANDAAEFDSTAGAAPQPVRATGLSGLFTALVNRVTLSRQRRVDSEVGEFLASHGGQLTDDLERQISRKFGNQAGQW
jgi:hypothetical protein